MSTRDTILQELEELDSSLLNTSFSNVYRIPGDYFEGLPGRIMSRIRSMELESTREELGAESPLIKITRTNPYHVPGNYFDGLAEKLMAGVLQSGYSETPAKELESLSPLLSGLKKQVPYTVPDNYFETLTTDTKQTIAPAKVISLTNRKWFRYATAAIVIGFIALSGVVFLGNNSKQIDIDKNPHGWVEKNVVKDVSTDELNNFINLTDEEAPVIASTSNAVQVKELMKNVSDDAIEDFLNDTQAAVPDADDSQVLN
jgi:hypothetical protein